MPGKSTRLEVGFTATLCLYFPIVNVSKFLSLSKSCLIYLSGGIKPKHSTPSWVKIQPDDIFKS